MKVCARKGFTLIELLVVIAIIGLLATLSVVSFSTSREKARLAKGSGFEGQILRSTGDDLVGRWDFDECSGTIVDSSGYNNSVALPSGVAYSTNIPQGSSGCSLAFNGSGQVVINTPVMGARQTKTLWVYVSGSLSGNQYLLDQGANNNFMTALYGHISACESASASNCLTSGLSVVQNKWYFLAWVYDGTSLSFYVDGSLDNKAALSAVTPTTVMTLGNYGGGGSYRLIGNIDNVRIFNRSLSSKEIHQMYAQEVSQYLARE